MIKRVNELKGFEMVSSIYWVNSDGEVLSEYKDMKPIQKRITRPTKKSKNEYFEVCLSISRDNKKYVKVHRLVALAFIDTVEGKNQVNHKDENGLNNKLENLEWCSAKENSRYSNSKKVFCYDENGLKKIYDCVVDAALDGFNVGHVASCCRGYIPKKSSKPITKHKKHTFSYHELNMEEVVQRLSKPIL